MSDRLRGGMVRWFGSAGVVMFLVVGCRLSFTATPLEDPEEADASPENPPAQPAPPTPNPGTGTPSPGTEPVPVHPVPVPGAQPPSPSGWVTLYEENFESLPDFGAPTWARDTYPDDGPFSDNGQFFRNQGITPPTAYRISRPFGKDGWLTLESYSRDPQTQLNQLALLGADPDGPSNRVLRLRSIRHTDATIVRPTAALPARYRITVRVGHPAFGDGLGGNNGYSGGELAEPWRQGSATSENGFYWLSILDGVPRPHNNVYIHHHRKVTVDSDNHYPAWMEIFDGRSFVSSGRHPVMMFALDGQGATEPWTGKPFLSYSGGTWQPSGKIRAVDAYKDRTWYTVVITRDLDGYTLEVSGSFEFGGLRTYKGQIRTADACIWHYNRPGETARSACLDETSLPGLAGFPLWPANQGWPEYFMFGDPHSNYYEGQVHYDDLKLEIWKD